MMYPQRPPHPVVPYFLLSGFEGEEEFSNSEYEKTDDNIRGRFNLPIAQLANLPPELWQETFHIKMDDLGMTLEEFWTEGEISFLGLSQLKYVGEVHTIHLSTFLPSPAALSLGFQAPESLTLQDGTTVMVSAWKICARGYTGTNLFPLPEIDLTDDTPRVIVVLSNEDAEDEPPDPRFHPSFHHHIAFKKDDYIVSVASDLDLDGLKEIVIHHLVIEQKK